MKPKIKLVQTSDGTNYLVPFILITTLFFLWGFAHSILDVLNKHFQDALSISKTHSALIQAVIQLLSPLWLKKKLPNKRR